MKYEDARDRRTDAVLALDPGVVVGRRRPAIARAWNSRCSPREMSIADGGSPPAHASTSGVCRSAHASIVRERAELQLLLRARGR